MGIDWETRCSRLCAFAGSISMCVTSRFSLHGMQLRKWTSKPFPAAAYIDLSY
jgi:hypothetical protein